MAVAWRRHGVARGMKSGQTHEMQVQLQKVNSRFPAQHPAGRPTRRCEAVRNDDFGFVGEIGREAMAVENGGEMAAHKRMRGEWAVRYDRVFEF